MNPFKIFVFTFFILIIVFLFKHRDCLNPKGIAADQDALKIQKPVDVNRISERNDTIVIPKDGFNVPVPDTPTTFFEGHNVDSCLANFIHQLQNNNDTLLRIIFFGDSQLEGDFFTSPVRKKLQSIFGGVGIGYMPAEMYFNTTENLAIVTSDFEKRIVHNSMPATNDTFGLYGRYFMPQQPVCKLRIKNRSHRHNFLQLKILYSGSATLTINDGMKFNKTMKLAGSGVAVETIEFQTTPDDLKLTFTDHHDLKIYGMLFDPLKGVVVDHVPFRGNLNLMMNHFGEDAVQEFGQLLNPSLIVLQYGLNVIPDVRKNYQGYRIAVQRDIHLIKKYLPHASILLIGAPDMAHKVDGEMVAYANIDAIIEAQLAAARNEKVAFWNLRKAMGGNGAVVQWVNDDLARTDYAHLNAKGAEKIALLLVDDLLKVMERNSKNND